MVSSGNSPTSKSAWVTIGTFDGVHLGHRSILDNLVKGARENYSQAIVVTFFPYPSKVLKKTIDPYYLTTPEEKDRLIAATGVDSILTLHFDHPLASQTAREFMEMLCHQLHFTCLLIGYDFRLGRNREGDIQTLKSIGEKLGYCVRALHAHMHNAQPVSSSRIRSLLAAGDVQTAASLLGRYYEVSGEVIHGDGRGRHIGIPTANLDVWREKMVPASGVYAARSEIDGKILQAVINIGSRPTFYNGGAAQTIEAHLLDFHEEIYGRLMKLQLIKRLRPETRFEDASALMIQIKRDIEETRELLANASIEKNLFA